MRPVGAAALPGIRLAPARGSRARRAGWGSTSHPESDDGGSEPRDGRRRPSGGGRVSRGARGTDQTNATAPYVGILRGAPPAPISRASDSPRTPTGGRLCAALLVG